MPLYPQEIIEEVRSLNDIVDVVGGYVALRQRGGNHFGLCPFHNEKSPSFSVNTDKQIYYCFGCGAGGNVISFIMQIENFDFMEALKLLADRVHYTLPQPEQTEAARSRLRLKETLAVIHKKAARFYYDTLQADTAEARAVRVYLDERGVHPKARILYGLGLSPPGWNGLLDYLTGQGYTPAQIHQAGLAVRSQSDPTGNRYHDRFRGRLMFPILDAGGQVIGFGGRVLDGGEPKYLNSPETPLFDKSRCLYGLHLARKARTKEIVIVEGYMDVISLYQAGFTNAAGVLGTALSAEHTRQLKKIGCESVILLLDSDEAGSKAALRAIPVLLAGGLKVKVLQVTGAKDPDEYLRVYGSARFSQLLVNAQSHIAFRVGLLRKKYALDVTEQRVAFTQEAAAVLSELESAIETDAYVSEIAASTGISPDAIYAEVNRGRAGKSALPVRERSGFIKRSDRNEKGLREARKGLISLLFGSLPACRALYGSGALPPEETGNEVTACLLTLAYECGQANRLIAPADAINRFETLPEQQQAAELLRGSTEYTTLAETEKALNEMITVIKRAWIDEQMVLAKTDGEIDLNAVKSLSEAKGKLARLYITMTDG